MHAFNHALGAMSEHGNVHVGLRSEAAIDRSSEQPRPLLIALHLKYGRMKSTTTSTASSSTLRGTYGRSPHWIMLAWRPCSTWRRWRWRCFFFSIRNCIIVVCDTQAYQDSPKSVSISRALSSRLGISGTPQELVVSTVGPCSCS